MCQNLSTVVELTAIACLRSSGDAVGDAAACTACTSCSTERVVIATAMANIDRQ
jgi:hypothetical protein